MYGWSVTCNPWRCRIPPKLENPRCHRRKYVGVLSKFDRCRSIFFGLDGVIWRFREKIIIEPRNQTKYNKYMCDLLYNHMCFNLLGDQHTVVTCIFVYFYICNFVYYLEFKTLI